MGATLVVDPSLCVPPAILEALDEAHPVDGKRYIGRPFGRFKGSGSGAEEEIFPETGMARASLYS